VKELSGAKMIAAGKYFTQPSLIQMTGLTELGTNWEIERAPDIKKPNSKFIRAMDEAIFAIADDRVDGAGKIEARFVGKDADNAADIAKAMKKWAKAAVKAGADRKKPKKLFGGKKFQAFLMAEEDAILEGLKNISVETNDKTASWVVDVELTSKQKKAREPWLKKQRSRAKLMAAVLRGLTEDKWPDEDALVAIGCPKKDD
jgi:hypothetical protein